MTAAIDFLTVPGRYFSTHRPTHTYTFFSPTERSPDNRTPLRRWIMAFTRYRRTRVRLQIATYCNASAYLSTYVRSHPGRNRPARSLSRYPVHSHYLHSHPHTHTYTTHEFIFPTHTHIHIWLCIPLYTCTAETQGAVNERHSEPCTVHYTHGKHIKASVSVPVSPHVYLSGTFSNSLSNPFHRTIIYVFVHCTINVPIYIFIHTSTAT